MANVLDEFREHNWLINTARDNNPMNQHFFRYEDWYLWNQDLKSMEAESKKITTLRREIGWAQHGTMKRISSMPLHVFTWLRHIDPELFQSTDSGMKKYHRFLTRFPEFTVR